MLHVVGCGTTFEWDRGCTWQKEEPYVQEIEVYQVESGAISCSEFGRRSLLEKMWSFIGKSTDQL